MPVEGTRRDSSTAPSGRDRKTGPMHPHASQTPTPISQTPTPIRHRPIALVACVILGVAIGAAATKAVLPGHSGASTSRSASATGGASAPAANPGSSPPSVPDATQLLAAANAANASTTGMQERASARITITGNGAGTQTTVLRDEIHATKQAGQYRFLVACAGTGQVWAEARIGDQDQGAVVPCGLPPNAFPIQLTTTTQSDSGSVTIVPITSAAVAVAYQIAFG
jgi:hypothetical protein